MAVTASVTEVFNGTIVPDNGSVLLSATADTGTCVTTVRAALVTPSEPAPEIGVRGFLTVTVY